MDNNTKRTEDTDCDYENHDLVFNGYVTDEHGETLAEFSGVLVF